MNNIFYLETSALNSLADLVKDFELFNGANGALKVDFCLSPISVWELLLNKDHERRDWLIYWAQFNCAPYLLKSPSELIVEYISNNCPRKDRKEFWDNRKTKLDIGKTWSNIHGKIDRTLLIEASDLDALIARTAPIRTLSRKLEKVISDMTDRNKVGYHEDAFHSLMVSALESLKQDSEISIERERLVKLTLIFTWYFLCIGMELDNSVIRKYWGNVGIDLNDDKPFERLHYIIEHHPQIFERGPLLEMAKMADTQIMGKNSKSRGLVHDSLHSVYCYYADNFISDDDHFKALRNETDDFAFSRIVTSKEYESIWKSAVSKDTDYYCKSDHIS